VVRCGRGGIGRRARFRSSWPRCRGGSSPSARIRPQEWRFGSRESEGRLPRPQLAAALDQDNFRTQVTTDAEAKLALLRRNQEQIRFGGRLMFNQKRANARFSSAATVHNAA
jgi:LmbE family N-acetylglucosaminyl deacetylase